MKEYPQLLIAGKNGKIYNHPRLAATGMKGGCFSRLKSTDLVPLPRNSELFLLPARAPVGYDRQQDGYIWADRVPGQKKKIPTVAVAAFVSPGYTITHNTAYIDTGKSPLLPLFSYAAVAFYKGTFHVAATRVDRELRQDLRFMPPAKIKKNAAIVEKMFPRNRLFRHLQRCALSYSCPAAKNLFLGRYEAPLPTSPVCNSRCLGCISHQPDRRCQITQPRITFVPTPEEIAEVALFHIPRVKDPVVSFGQGCEGEPLMSGKVIERAIKLIRKKTHKGIINLNTNASRPETISRLFAAGLDSIRISLNSVREEYYNPYFKPVRYKFSDVCRSVKNAKTQKGFVSINYLTVPGFTDLRSEYIALRKFLKQYRIDMIQWRNLNYDPLSYFRDLKIIPKESEMLGIKKVISGLRQEFPQLLMGYFNPARGRIKRKR